MPNIPPTPAQLRALLPEFASLTDEDIQEALDLAANFVKPAVYPEAYYLPAAIYLAGHFLYLNTVAVGQAGGSLSDRLRSISYGPMSIGLVASTQNQNDQTGTLMETPSVYLERYRMLRIDPGSAVVLDGSHAVGLTGPASAV